MLWKGDPEGEGSRYRFLIVASVCFFLVLIFLAVFGEHGWLAVSRVRGDVMRLQQEISRLRQENRELREEIAILKTDPSAIEQIARDELGMVQPGEVVYEIVDRREASEADQAEQDGGKAAAQR